VNNQIRSIVFKGLQPWGDLQSVYMNIVRIEDDAKDIESYDRDIEWTRLERAYNYKHINDTRYAFACAFLTGKKYRMHWGHMFPMDWKTLMLFPSIEEWKETDSPVII